MINFINVITVINIINFISVIKIINLIRIYEMHQSKLFLSLLFNRVDVAKKHMRELRTIAREYKITQLLGEDLWVIRASASPFVCV